jgi:hypothetical protein
VISLAESSKIFCTTSAQVIRTLSAAIQRGANMPGPTELSAVCHPKL